MAVVLSIAGGKWWRTFVRVLLLLFLFVLSADSQGAACPWYSRLASYVFPSKRPVSTEAYDNAKAKWDSVLSLDKNISLDTLLAKLKDESASSPESLMALMDALGPKGHVPFKAWLAELDDSGIQVRFSRMGRDERLRRHDDLKWKWKFSWAVPPVKRKAAILDVWLPDTPPENAQDLLARFFTLSAALPGAQLEMTARKAPLLSLPVGNWEISYPKQLRNSVQKIEERVYGTLHDWEARWGKVPLELPGRGTGNWIGSFLTLPIPLAWRAFFPMYNPVAKYRPNQKGYAKYKEGFEGTQHGGPSPLERDIQNRYQMRGTEKYIVDAYLRALKIAGSVALVRGLYNLSVALNDGTLKAVFEASALFMAGMGDGEKLNADLKRYEEDEAGNPVVIQFYADQIKLVEKEIAGKGDPAGKLAKKIQELIIERDFLKN